MITGAAGGIGGALIRRFLTNGDTVNLTGTFLMARALLPLMKAREGGRIINFGSTSMFEGIAGHHGANHQRRWRKRKALTGEDK